MAGEGCLLRLGRWRCIQRQLLWDDPEGLATRANPNMLFFRGHALGVFKGVGGPSLLWSHLLRALTWLSFPKMGIQVAGLEVVERGGVPPGSVQGGQSMRPAEMQKAPAQRTGNGWTNNQRRERTRHAS